MNYGDATSAVDDFTGEYLRREREAEERHEYDNGRMCAMAGESPNHSRICINAARETSANLKGKSCEASSPNMKVCIYAAGKFYYPDLSIVCEKARYHDRERDALVNPNVIIEVLSPSSEKRDRSVKFLAYQQIESLTDYLLVSQDKLLRAASGRAVALHRAHRSFRQRSSAIHWLRFAAG